MARLLTVTDAKRRRTAADAWLERMNPLRGLSIRQAEGIYDAARGGNFALLHLLYSEIEKTDPVLLTCVERRAAALAGLGWKADTVAGADAGLAKEQSAAIGELVAGIGNFEEALEHLDGGFFRGYSHAEPVHGSDGSVRSLLLPESWNFCREPGTGAWWWNPDALTEAPGMGGMTEIPPGRLVTVCRPRAIDYPALSIYLRCALAERDWGRFVERYGLPPAILTAPANTTPEQETKLAAAAGDVADGRSGVVPNGTAISFATEARGTDPFTAFIEHQEKLVVLLATGGTLTSLAEAGSGTLAGNAQMDVWRQIVSRDAAIIGAALDRTLVQPYLRARFPGRPAAASFALDADRRRSAEEEFEVAAKARTGGYRIRKDELEKRTSYSLEEEESTPGPGSMLPGGVWNAERPIQGVAKPLQNARGGAGATTEKPPSAGILEPSAADEGVTRVARALQKDLRPAARIIAEALRTGDWKAACKKLAGALKECGTESAEALEREMLAAGEKAWPETHAEAQRGGGAEGDGDEDEGLDLIAVANNNPNREEDGQFAEAGTGDRTGGRDDETSYEKRRRTCQEALDKFNASDDHPTAEDVASGKITIRSALEKGFSATFAGHRLVFFTEEKVLRKYEGRGEGWKIDLIPEMVGKGNKMLPKPHSGDQTVFIESRSRENAGKKKLVAIADTQTGVVVHVGRESEKYIRDHY